MLTAEIVYRQSELSQCGFVIGSRGRRVVTLLRANRAEPSGSGPDM
jgi:hypothetical protein